MSDPVFTIPDAVSWKLHSTDSVYLISFAAQLSTQSPAATLVVLGHWSTHSVLEPELSCSSPSSHVYGMAVITQLPLLLSVHDAHAVPSIALWAEHF